MGEEDFILWKSCDSPEILWTNLESCVWRGPEWFDYKYCLASMDEYKTLEPLFTHTLGLQDAQAEDMLDYLGHLKQRGGTYSLESIKRVYQELKTTVEKENKELVTTIK
jgi:hypothetical protein